MTTDVKQVLVFGGRPIGFRAALERTRRQRPLRPIVHDVRAHWFPRPGISTSGPQK